MYIIAPDDDFVAMITSDLNCNAVQCGMPVIVSIIKKKKPQLLFYEQV